MIFQLRNSLALATCAVVSFPLHAFAYDTGAMSCDDIGNYASSVVQGKQRGMSEIQALATVKENLPTRHEPEAKILTDIVKQIYTAPFAMHLTSDGAFSVYKADCDAQQ